MLWPSTEDSRTLWSSSQPRLDEPGRFYLEEEIAKLRAEGHLGMIQAKREGVFQAEETPFSEGAGNAQGILQSCKVAFCDVGGMVRGVTLEVSKNIYWRAL